MKLRHPDHLIILQLIQSKRLEDGVAYTFNRTASKGNKYLETIDMEL